MLRDVVFSAGPGQAAAEFDRLVSSFPELIRSGAIGHVAKEYSTLDWIMQGLFERAGFQVLLAEPVHTSFIACHCRKAGHPDRKPMEGNAHLK